jgi:hypothetical protein
MDGLLVGLVAHLMASPLPPPLAMQFAFLQFHVPSSLHSISMNEEWMNLSEEGMDILYFVWKRTAKIEGRKR